MSINHAPVVRIHIVLWLFLTLTFFNTSTAYALEQAGNISFARGTAAAHNGDTKPRLLGKDSPVYVGDNIQTSPQSFVIIAFNDGSKITVRPESSFTVDQFEQSTDNTAAKMTLHKGGVRTSSGDIAEQHPDKFQIATPDTTIKAQQADFSVRVCEGDQCQQEEDSIQKGKASAHYDVIARIVEVRGAVTAVSESDLSQEPRLLTVGAPIYASDKLTSELGGYAVLVFKDKGRVTLDQNSVFSIKEYSYKQAEKADNAVYDLVTGGMRVLTGLITKDNKEAFKHDTPVATIGIRGTGYSAVMQDKLHVGVWQGTIRLNNPAGSLDVGQLSTYKFAKVENKESAPEPVDNLPDTAAAATNGPRPDEVEVENEPELFSYSNLDRSNSGTYVDVHEGHVQVENEDGSFVNLGRGESTYTTPTGKTIRVETPPKFMSHDQYPLPSGEFNEATAELTTYSLLADTMQIDESNNVLQCVCP
jgi:hypothetical protein